MVTEPRTPDHRWFQKQNHIKLPKSYVTKSEISAEGVALIDQKITDNVLAPLLLGAAVLALWDASDMSTLFQDRAGSIPVTAAGQLIGMQLDKGRGLVLGPELVVNGGFSTDSDWTKGVGWTISGGSANKVPGSFSEISQNVNAIPGQVYQIEFDLNATVGGVAIRFGNETTQATATANGRHVFRLQCGNSDGVLRLRDALSTGNYSIDNVSVRRLPGLHKVAINDAARGTLRRAPVTGRRNLSNASQLLSASVVSGQGYFVNISTGTRTGGSGVPNDDIETPEIPFYWRTTDTSYGIFSVAPVVSGETYTVKMRLRSFGADITGFTSAVYASSVISSSGFPVTAAEGWKDVTVTFVSNGAMTLSPTGNSGNWGYVRFQVEAGDTATAYQKVTNDNDITEAGVRSIWSIKTDGINTGYVTPSIDPGVDKVQVFAGARKLSDASTGYIIELSASFASNAGSFAVVSRNGGGYLYRSRGTNSTDVTVEVPLAPVTNVLTGLSNISGDAALLHVDGELAAFSVSDQGTGNFGSYPLYFYRRGGTTLPFNGESSIEIVRFGDNLSPELIAQTERFIANKTGVTL